MQNKTGGADPGHVGAELNPARYASVSCAEDIAHPENAENRPDNRHNTLSDWRNANSLRPCSR